MFYDKQKEDRTEALDFIKRFSWILVKSFSKKLPELNFKTVPIFLSHVSFLYRITFFREAVTFIYLSLLSSVFEELINYGTGNNYK